MAQNNLSVPDSIKNQNFRVSTNLEPAANPISVYAAPTPRDMAPPPQQNALGQLAHGLSVLQPTLQHFAIEEQKKREDEDLIAGKAASEEMQKRNVTDINEAVKQGIIKAGQSPVFLQSLRENQLAHSLDRHEKEIRAAYWSDDNADLRASNDMTRFDEFVAKHREGFDNEIQGQYTTLDMARAKYAERTRDVAQSLYSEHLQYRIGENEKAGEEVAGLRTTDAINKGLDNGWDHKQIADTVNAIYRDPNTGLVTAGMKGSKQSQLTVDAVVGIAIERRDPKVLGILDQASTSSPGNLLSGTQYAKKAIEAAKLHITQEVYMEQERSRQAAERRGAGIATDPEVEARAKETRDRNEAEYALKVKQMSHAGSVLDKAVQAEPEQSAIMKHLANGSSAFDPEVIDHMKKLADIDPSAYQQMATYVQGQQLKQKTEGDAKVQLQTYSQLRSDLSSDPSKFDRGRIIAAANQGHLTAGQVSSLYDDADKQAAAFKEFPILQSSLVTQMRTDLRAATMKSPMDEFGEGRLRADKAGNEFNDMVLDYVKTHPQAGAYEISKAMRPEVERLSRLNNQELGQSMAQAEESVKTQEQVRKATEQTRQIQQLDKATSPGQKLTPQQLSTLLSKEDKSKLHDLATSTFRPGVEKKPTSEQDLIDGLKSILQSHYQGRPGDLADAINGILPQLRKAYSNRK
jgi:hypothetical protein